MADLLDPVEALRRTAAEALADADEAWTQVLDEGGNPGDRFDIMVTSLLTWGDDEGVTIRHDGSLSPALAALPAPVPEGVPEDHRVCSHGIYHHGCPSCDRQDPEERL